MASSKVKIVVRQCSPRDWEWALINRGQELASSVRTWDSKAKARRAAEAVARHAANAPVVVEG